MSAGQTGYVHAWFSKQGSTPTPWARGLRDQIQKWARQSEKTLFSVGFSVLRGGFRDRGLGPWSRKGPDHGVGVDPETVNGCAPNVEVSCEIPLCLLVRSGKDLHS